MNLKVFCLFGERMHLWFENDYAAVLAPCMTCWPLLACLYGEDAGLCSHLV